MNHVSQSECSALINALDLAGISQDKYKEKQAPSDFLADRCGISLDWLVVFRKTSPQDLLERDIIVLHKNSKTPHLYRASSLKGWFEFRIQQALASQLPKCPSCTSALTKEEKTVLAIQDQIPRQKEILWSHAIAAAFCLLFFQGINASEAMLRFPLFQNERLTYLSCLALLLLNVYEICLSSNKSPYLKIITHSISFVLAYIAFTIQGAAEARGIGIGNFVSIVNGISKLIYLLPLIQLFILQ